MSTAPTFPGLTEQGRIRSWAIVTAAFRDLWQTQSLLWIAMWTAVFVLTDYALLYGLEAVFALIDANSPDPASPNSVWPIIFFGVFGALLFLISFALILLPWTQWTRSQILQTPLFDFHLATFSATVRLALASLVFLLIGAALFLPFLGASWQSAAPGEAVSPLPIVLGVLGGLVMLYLFIRFYLVPAIVVSERAWLPFRRSWNLTAAHSLGVFRVLLYAALIVVLIALVFGLGVAAFELMSGGDIASPADQNLAEMEDTHPLEHLASVLGTAFSAGAIARLTMTLSVSAGANG